MRRFTFYLLVASMMACGAEVAVTEDGGIDAAVGLDADVTPPDDGSTNPTEDADVPDASEPPFCLTFDPPDEYGRDDDCDGAEGTRERSVYVSNDGDDTFAGSPNYPVKTLARAVELVDRTPSREYVFVAASADAYDADGLGDLLERGVSVYGSLSVASGWARPEGPDTTLTTTFQTDGDGVRAHVTDPRVELAFVRIVGRRAPAQRHSVGLTLTGQGTVDLSFVDVVTDDAMDGEPGAAGIDAPSADAGAVNWADEDETYLVMEPRRGGAGGAVKTCPGMTGAESQITRGGKGGDGKACGSCAPEAGEDGGGGATGGARGVHGDRSGKDGGSGAHGVRGSDAGSLSFDDWSIVDGRIIWTEAASAHGGSPGGGGGGGGGAQHDGSGCLNNRAPGGTGGGAGGCPGTAGENGRSGGFSVGILALGAAPELHAVRIQTGRGGDGGAAGHGGSGVSGGTSPESISVWCNNYAGGRGGDGGDGGDGGHGAPGGGGWTIGILGASPIESVDGVTFTLGAPGAAGAAITGGPTSENGLTHQVLVR